MKKILLLSSILFLHFTLSAQITFQKLYGGTQAERVYSVLQTTDGGYIMAGATQSYGVLGWDVYLIKTNSTGDTLWTKTWGETVQDVALSARQTTDNGYILTGYTNNSGAGNYDVFLIKTDSAGNTLWENTYGAFDDDYGYSVQQTLDGGYIVVGYSKSFGGGNWNLYLIKTDSIGDGVWTKTYGATGIEYGNSVRQTSDGGFIIAGQTYSFSAGNRAVYLIRTDSMGDTLWTKAYGGANFECGNSVQQTSDGGFIIAGYTTSFGAGSYDFYLIKTDSIGTIMWSRTYGGPLDDQAFSVQQTSDDGFIIAGYTSSFGAGAIDIYLVKTNSAGDTLWTKSYGGTGYSLDACAWPTSDGGFVVAGRTNSFLAPWDIYLIKTDSLGNSGCNQGNTTTIVDSPVTQVLTMTTPTVVSSVNTTQLPFVPVLSSGGNVTTLCIIMEANEISKEIANDILIYPNPSQNKLIIESISPITSFELNDISGKLLKKEIIRASHVETDLSSLSSGIYFLTIDTKAGEVHKKIVKE